MDVTPDNLKRDIIKARVRVKDTREKLTHNLEKRAKAAGKSVNQFSRETYDKMEKELDDIHEKISTGSYKFGVEIKESASGIYDELYNIHQMVRSFRREITGGVVEDQTLDVLRSVEQRLDDIVGRLRDDQYGVKRKEKKRPVVRKLKKQKKQ